MSSKKLFQERNLPEGFYANVKHAPSRSMFSRKIDGEWKDLKADQALDFVLRSMQCLKALGFQRGDRICIFSENREEWVLTDYAAQWLGGSTTSIYTTSSSEEVHYILKSSGARFLFISNQDMMDRANEWGGLDQLECLLCWDEVKRTPSGLKVVARNELLKEAMPIQEAEALLGLIKPEDMAILLYTSGTTGEPKGVVLSQKNICSNIRQMQYSMPLQDLSVTMSFLPLCHIYERALQSTLLLAGIKICFAESIDKLVENMADMKPDIMIGVPRVFEKMYVRIHEALRNAPLSKKIAAKLAFQIGKATVPYRIRNERLPLSLDVMQAIADRMVFHKIRGITGGRLKYFVSGGAPLSQSIAEFFFQAGITILEGYGLSETIILAYNRPGKIKFGTVGQPLEETTFRIAEDGEILVKGPQVFKSYFHQPELTAEVFTEDGFFKTGDIGELDQNQYLRITDRKKELIKTAGGKYIAPQPIENQLKADPLVENATLIGDRRKYVVALIVPNAELCKSWGAQKGVKLQSMADCTKSEELRAHYQSLIDRINSGLPRYSTIKYFAILERAFSIDTGELTPTMKLKRRVVEENHRDQIDELYPEEDRIAAI